MATLLDEETVLEALDLNPPCERQVGSAHEAQVAMRCRGCRNCAFLCRAHYTRFRRRVERMLRRSDGIVCSSCHRTSATFDEAIEVVDI